MIKLKHKQTNKEWNYSATVWFKKGFDINDYDILEWYDVVELFYDKPNKMSSGKMERRDAVQIIDEHPHIGYWFEDVIRPDIKKLPKPKVKPKPKENSLQRRKYEQTVSELILGNVRESHYKHLAEKQPIKTTVMNEDEKAISLFEAQKQKIDASPNSDDQFWRNETLTLVEKFIGKESHQYELLKDHTFWPNLKAENIETADSQRERGRSMINSCINHIKAHGAKKESLVPQTVNFHYNFPESTNPVINTIQNSSLNNLSNFDTHTNNNTNAKTPTNKSWIEVVYWIVGILVSLGLLYEFVIKNILAK
jgi:hypothetical protein